MKMGVFKTKIKVTTIDDLKFKKAVQLEAWVDSGSTLTQIPSSILKHLGIKSVRRSEFELGDGRAITRSVGGALIMVEGIITFDEVAFGDAHCTPILGSTTLEHTALLIDPKNERLVKRRGIIQYAYILNSVRI